MFVERTSVGLDVHARSVVAAAIDGLTGEVFEKRLTPCYEQITSWIRTLPGPWDVAYEAGPTGFGLCRYLRGQQIRCQVVAPSKLQRPGGDRVMTDRRDALHLARLVLLGQITAVAVPSLEQEAARDLVRAREDARGDLMRARHRLSKLLLRYGIVYDAGRAWTGKHDLWLRREAVSALKRAAGSVIEATFDADYDAVRDVAVRRDRLDQTIAQMADASQFTPVVRNLGCLRGISTLTGFALAVEIGDWSRFTGASIASFVGLVPSEHSSGSSRAQGPITKAGNAHARRLLVEAAWHHRPAYRPSIQLRQRWDLAPAPARRRGDEGNRRLHQRWNAFIDRKKRPTVATTAIARELAGWCWSLATLDEPAHDM